MDPRIADIEKEYRRDDLPSFAPGDTIRVRVRVREGDKERVQPFEGLCIARRGGGANATFTLRRVSGGVGVERIFPLHSPWISGLEVVRRGDVRRAKLYYLRERRGKRARVRERKWWLDAEALAEMRAAATGQSVEEAAAEIADVGSGDLADADADEIADALGDLSPIEEDAIEEDAEKTAEAATE